MTQPIAFFCRARPQDADAFPIFRAAKRVFIGYPLWRKGITYNPRALHTCIVDPTCSDKEWNREAALERINISYTKNRNFVPRIKQGSIVVIPRPEDGAVYIARIVGPFEIVNSPPWAEDYLDLRESQGLEREDEDFGHIGDVAQGWPVDEYRRISLTRVPGWIRRAMFGRSTYGRLPAHPFDGKTTAYSVLNHLLDGGAAEPLTWTLDHEEIKRRLVDTLTANAFEHLVVSLLQLEHPHEIWHQTGGAGDGGIDGLGCDESGEVVGLLQSKLYAEWPPEFFLEEDHETFRRYVAVLVLDNPDPPDEGATFLGIEEIAGLVGKHWRHLPQAVALRIGEA